MKRILFGIVLAVILLTACGGGEKNEIDEEGVWLTAPLVFCRGEIVPPRPMGEDELSRYVCWCYEGGEYSMAPVVGMQQLHTYSQYTERVAMEYWGYNQVEGYDVWCAKDQTIVWNDPTIDFRWLHEWGDLPPNASEGTSSK